jgi:transcriptional regulator with XRE-family HTH domain
MNFNTGICKHCGGTGRALDHVALGAHQRAMREKAGKSLRAIAAKMKVSAPYLSDLENGRRNWTEEKVEAYRKALK